MKWKEKLKWVKFIIPVALFIAIVFALKKQLSALEWSKMYHYGAQLSINELMILLFVGMFSVATMLLYDLFLVREWNINVPKKKLAMISFSANSMANFLGFGGVVGAGVRSYFYRDYVEHVPTLVGRIAYVTPFLLTGLSALTVLLSTTIIDASFITDEYSSVHYALIAFSGYFFAWTILSFYMNRQKRSAMSQLKRVGFLTVTSIVEWICAFFTFYATAVILGIHVDAATLFCTFVISSVAGTLTTIPGGLGAFEFITVFALGLHGVESEHALFLVVMYRVFYYMIPFFISLVLLGSHYFAEHRWLKVIKGIWKATMTAISHRLLTLLVFASGLLVLFSAVLPSTLQRMQLASSVTNFGIMQISQQLQVTTGIVLLVLSRAIASKVVRAYYYTFVAIFAGAVFAFIKGLEYEEVFVLLVISLLLLSGRRHFYRLRFTYSWSRLMLDSMALLLILTLFTVVGLRHSWYIEQTLPREVYELVYFSDFDVIRSGVVGVLLAIGVLAFAFLGAKQKAFPGVTVQSCEHQVREHLAAYGGNELSHFIWLHDKQLYWAQDGNVLFVYKRYADKLMVLGDPLGDERQFAAAINEFHEKADQYGFLPVYYQASQQLMPVLHDAGYHLFKLGEDSYVDLATYTLSGKRRATLRSLRNKFHNTGFRTVVVQPPFTNEQLLQMKAISDDWLAGRVEKGYSLGFFAEHYINEAPVMFVYNDQDEMTAFVSFRLTHQETLLSIDLMRFLASSPKGTMDFLFMELIDWAKQQGYASLNLGMAPLSNVGASRFSFISEKVAAKMFQYGNFLYGFTGVRAFKEKYADIWQSRYLAYHKKTGLLLTVIQVSLLIRKAPNHLLTSSKR